MIKLAAPLVLLVAAGAFAPASAQEGPSFDCAKASTVVEHQICDSAPLSRYDLWIGMIYSDLRTRLDSDGQETLKEEQRDWLKEERNACADATPSIEGATAEGARYSCLFGAYVERAVVLALELEELLGSSDEWSGFYVLDDGYASGSLLLLQLGRSMALEIQTVAGPTYHICDLAGTGARRNGDEVTFDADRTESDCHVSMLQSEGGLKVLPTNCSYFCGANGYFAGFYEPATP